MPYDNNNRGALFKNTRMREGKRDPLYTGQCTVGGVEYWLKCWLNESKKDGSKYFSLQFDEKQATEERAEPARSTPKQEVEGFNDDIPF